MSLTVSGYMRQLYKGNSYGATVNGRSGQPAHSLFSADMNAVRRAVKELNDYDYDEGEGTELMNKVQAFVDTYNNYIDSAKGMNDDDVNRYMSKMKKLTKEHASELEDIGITIQSSGKLKLKKKDLQDTSRYDVGQLFSKDAEYAKMTEKQMKLTQRMFLRNNLNIPKQSAQTKKSGTDNNTQTTAEGLLADSMKMQSAQQAVQGMVGNTIDYML